MKLMALMLLSPFLSLLFLFFQLHASSEHQRYLPLTLTLTLTLTWSSFPIPPHNCVLLSVTSLSLSLSPPPPSHLQSLLLKKSTTLSPPIPLQYPISPNPRRPRPTSDPSSSTAGIHQVSIVWFRNDLRVHDHECLNTANNQSLLVLPVYCFDPSDYSKSASGFGRAGPSRATFLVDFVSDLRANLQARGSDLVVRVGKPETILVELAKETGASALYAHSEVSEYDIKVEAAMKEHGVEVNYLWGSSSLLHVDDLPFRIEDMPTHFDLFRKEVMSLEIRKSCEAVDQFKCLPDVELGEIPSLMDLMPQEGRPASNASIRGGETEAMQWLTKMATECQAQPHKKGNNNSKISPWLTMGCLSPRSMLDELKNSASRTFSAASNRKDGGSGPSYTAVNWWRHEFVWVDFFRFITKKYSSAKQHNAAAVTACTSATGSVGESNRRLEKVYWQQGKRHSEGSQTNWQILKSVLLQS